MAIFMCSKLQDHMYTLTTIITIWWSAYLIHFKSIYFFAMSIWSFPIPAYVGKLTKLFCSHINDICMWKEQESFSHEVPVHILPPLGRSPSSLLPIEGPWTSVQSAATIATWWSWTVAASITFGQRREECLPAMHPCHHSCWMFLNLKTLI